MALNKMIDCDYEDVVIALDAAGGMASVFHPHFHSHSKNEIQRHDLLKVHCFFVKIHDFGVLIYRGVVRLEACNGGNFTTECLYRALIYFIEKKRETRPNFTIRSIRFQGDNAKGNKCWTVLSAIAALVAYGVCIKAKLCFGLANHNHTDIDAAIGTTISKICHQNLVTLEEFEQACCEAIQVCGSEVLSVQELCNVPDYGAFFDFVGGPHITGVDGAHLFRFAGVENSVHTGGLRNVTMHIKYDVRQSGYHPR
jgi:hypothetical protein